MPTFKVLPGRPPQQFAEMFKDTLGGSLETIERFNRWLRENVSSFQSADLNGILHRVAQETGLDRRDVASLVTMVANLGLFADSDETFDKLQQDLRTLGFLESDLEAFRRLMDGVRFPKGESTLAVAQSLSTGVATLVDVNVLCDLRAVFEASASDGEISDKQTKLVALVPCVILSLDVRHESGRTDTVVMQFSEHAFGKFQQTLGNAARQLDAIKAMATMPDRQSDK